MRRFIKLPTDGYDWKEVTMDDKKYLYLEIEEVQALMMELDHLFISRDNIICYVVIQRMEQFIRERKAELENAGES